MHDVSRLFRLSGPGSASRAYPVLAAVLGVLLFTAAVAQQPASGAEGASRKDSRQRAAVETVLRVQSEAWSKGDLETFSSFYSKDSIFVSPNGVTRGGPQEIFDRYRKRYTDTAAMGELTLDVEDYQPAGKRGAVIVARWTLRYPDEAEREEASGMTLLVLRKERGRWVISRDASM